MGGREGGKRSEGGWEERVRGEIFLEGGEGIGGCQSDSEGLGSCH